MGTMKRELNEYLSSEFGVGTAEGDQERVREDWPFVLQLAFSFDLYGEVTHVFSFDYEAEAYFAVYGTSLNCFPQAGLDSEAFKHQLIGSSWIGSREPLDLDTSRGDDPVVPRIPERRQRFQHFAQSLRADAPYKILVGLYLVASQEYLGLIQFEGESEADIVGDRITMRNIPYPGLSPWRRLSIGIGKLVTDGRLG
jgi:hypothetical protein